MRNNGEWIQDMLGYTTAELDESVISADGFDRRVGKTVRGLAKVIEVSQLIGYTLQHELGHQNGLVEMNRNRALVGRHCGNICVMRSIPVAEIKHFQLELSRATPSYFCSECSADLDS